MAEEIAFEDLGLKKPLDKMTAKELRDMVIAKLPMISGVSGMDKDAIIVVGLSGRGDKDIFSVAKYLGVTL